MSVKKVQSLKPEVQSRSTFPRALQSLDFRLWTLDFRLPPLSKKSEQIRARIEKFRGRAIDPHYLGYFDCFNRQLFYEAHDVLEGLWLASRNTPNARYYQGLIMATGAFVHFQKDKPKAASNLLKTAIERLKPYGAFHEGFELGEFVEVLESWLYLPFLNCRDCILLTRQLRTWG